MRHLITQSILSAWLYTFNCQEGYEEDAWAEFIQKLNREPEESNPAKEDGIAFESLVNDLVNGKDVTQFEGDLVNPVTGEVTGHKKYPKWYNAASKIADILRGGQLQVRGSCTVTVDGEDFLLYGIADGMKAGVIYDIKKKDKSFSGLDLAGKYFESPQHPAYFRIFPGAYRFVYLVSDGQDIYTEVYERKDTKPIEETIRLFINWLKSFGLYEIYCEKWGALK